MTLENKVEQTKELLKYLNTLDDDIVFNAMFGYFRSDESSLNKSKVMLFDLAHSYYSDTDIKIFNDEINDIIDSDIKEVLSDKLDNLLEELNDNAFSIPVNIKESFEKGELESLFNNRSSIRELIDYLEEIKDDDELNRMLEISVFESDNYDNIDRFIIPVLEEIDKDLSNEKEMS